MSAKNIGKFALASILFAPKLAVEDVLREVGVKVPAKGLGYNEQGQSIMDIWNSSEPDPFEGEPVREEGEHYDW